MTTKRILELETLITKARHDYYNGTSKVSDQAFDLWIDELSKLDPKNLAVIGIGSEPVSNWEKYTHQVSMGSLNKVQTEEEYLDWHKTYLDKSEALLTLKLDGLSVSLIYENGVLVKAATRGSGATGELITANVAKMEGVPLRLQDKINITVRGEILLSKENHKKHFQDYSNPRNGASGIARRFDQTGSDKLSVLVYHFISDDLDIKTQHEMFQRLENLGFKVPTYYLLDNIDDILKLKNQYQSSLRDRYDFDLDGLVIHNNDLIKHAQFGSTNDRPKGSIAFKFEAEAKESFISDIVLQVGNSGRITPVAIFSPKVNLAGAEVEKASLHNFANITDLGIDIGCTALVCRSNDVIPFLEEVVKSTGTIFQKPNNCPTCNTKLVMQGEYLQCPNVENCPSQLAGRIKNWVKELNILELGETLIEKLVESKLVKTPADLYTLTIDQLAGLDRMGKKSAKAVHTSIWNGSTITLDILIGGLSIPMIGSSTIKLLMDDGYDNLDKLLSLTTEQAEAVKGIGSVKANSLINGLEKYKNIIQELLDNGLKIKDKIIGKLTGKSLAFTGTLTNKRAVLEQMAVDAGGAVKGSVGKGLSFLVINDLSSDSQKATTARSLGTLLINEDQFLDMLK